MLELITAIALLCQVHPATGNEMRTISPTQVDEYQLKCQQGYVKCIVGKNKPFDEVIGTGFLLVCIAEREIK